MAGAAQVYRDVIGEALARAGVPATEEWINQTVYHACWSLNPICVLEDRLLKLFFANAEPPSMECVAGMISEAA